MRVLSIVLATVAAMCVVLGAARADWTLFGVAGALMVARELVREAG